MMYHDVIGIVGGMGSYATLHFFQEILQAFPAEKEWDRPRVLIDNRCTMPSRVRAVLEGYQREKLVDEMCDSVQSLLNAGATKIVLACNTSHCFLPDICARIPEAQKAVVNIIENCCRQIAEDGIRQINIIASEGTIQSKIFENELRKYGIGITVPQNEEYLLQRELIEAVKQNKITDDVIEKFIGLVKSSKNRAIILGCTEFPVLYTRCDPSVWQGMKIYDPLLCVIQKLTEECK